MFFLFYKRYFGCYSINEPISKNKMKRKNFMQHTTPDTEKLIEKMSLEERIHVVREDLPGDALLSARLVKAAFENHWAEAEELLAAGAVPGICRRGDAFGVESALYFALKAQNFVLARKLFEAGDRLDDLVTESEEPLPAAVLDFLASEMRRGSNYFYGGSKTFSECCRSSCFEQIKALLPEAGQEELNKGFINTVYAWMVHFKEVDTYKRVLKDLLEAWAKISEKDKAELLSLFDRRFGNCPRPLHPGKEALEEIISLIREN